MQKYTVNSLLYDGSNKELNEIFAPLLTLNPSKIQVFVHGSWSDNSRTSFSDLDDFIIIDDDYYDLVKSKLDEVAFNFQKKDPLQHHGHWLVKKSQLRRYDNSYMPLFIMKEALCVLGNNQIIASINKQDSINKTVERIKGTCKNITFFYQQYKEGLLNIYDLKRFVGSVVLLPPLVFQIKGSDLDKRTAILKANSLYSKEVLKLIQWSTECRENWKLIVENSGFLEFSKKLQEFDSAEKWREYASLNSPVLNYHNLSSVVLNDELIDDFIKETLLYIDELKFKNKQVKEYEDAFEEVKRLSIEYNAIIVGQFGSIKYPSISDLDVFICFEDHEYKKGCLAIDDFIRSDESLSYLFTHSPLYVCKSMLHDIKFLHTIYDLNIVYNPYEIKINKELDKGYQNFLNIAWSYLIIQTMNSILSNIKYYDIRTLLLSLKNAQTSVFNIEKRLGIASEELVINHNTRVMVLKEGIKTRDLVESDYQRVYLKLNRLLYELDKGEQLLKKEFKISDVQYKTTDKTYVKGNVVYLNKVFSNLIYNIYKKHDKYSKIYLKTVRKNLKLHQKFGGYINTYIWVVPYNFVNYNLKKKIKRKLKSVLLKIVKGIS
ncbi:hypothetical protein AXE80_08495 [Wenyingzhuangia fucanilytica]|uniref:Uncharacterized protein n=1 Tax=Wenyingzhuangia fucanilytica TaxID=1790137 RepID=A0A1B1Y6F1_9FLAO|nr:hypothetical protein [Wenyingzhuangia fucanilytica]ANW96314.1 hypothetical protein AXE80_08495 [Wenyingzhuangia fucanilytica]